MLVLTPLVGWLDNGLSILRVESVGRSALQVTRVLILSPDSSRALLFLAGVVVCIASISTTLVILGWLEVDREIIAAGVDVGVADHLILSAVVAGEAASVVLGAGGGSLGAEKGGGSEDEEGVEVLHGCGIWLKWFDSEVLECEVEDEKEK